MQMQNKCFLMGAGIIVLTYQLEQLDYSGCFDGGSNYNTALPVSLQAAAYDETDKYLGQLDYQPVQGRASGLKRLIFAPPQTSQIILTITIPRAQEKNEPPAEPKLFAPCYTYVYEKNYLYMLPKAD